MSTVPSSASRVKVVLDTNVLVSAANFFGGNEFQVLLLAFQGRIDLYLSQFILDEVAKVLRAKFRWPEGRLDRTLVLLREWATIVDPAAGVAVIAGDESDNRILECCLEVGADYLVTGDQDLLPLQTFQETTIMNAGGFLQAVGIPF